MKTQTYTNKNMRAKEWLRGIEFEVQNQTLALHKHKEKIEGLEKRNQNL